MFFSKKILTRILHCLLVFAIVISLLGFLADLRNTLKYGGVDLRNRVVGARLLTRGLDPYHFRWSQGEDERLLDPSDNPKLPVSRVTVPPSILLLQSPLAKLPYFQQRLIWFILQWAAFIASFIFLIGKNTKNLVKFLSIIVLLFISGNSFWRLHVERGQLYVFYVFFLSLAYKILQKESNIRDILGGCLIGFTASIRLPVIIMFLPLIILRKFKIFAATALSYFLFSFAFIYITGQQTWASYFSAMSTIGKLTIGMLDLSNNNYIIVFPKIIEGMSNLNSALTVPHSNWSIQLILNKLNFKLQSNQLIVILCLLLLIYGGQIFLKYRNKIEQSRNLSLNNIFIIGTLMILITEWFIPAPRYTYNDIQLLIPLVLILKNINYLDFKSMNLACVLIFGLLVLSGTFPWIPQFILIGQFITVTTMIVMSLKNDLVTDEVQHLCDDSGGNNLTE